MQFLFIGITIKFWSFKVVFRGLSWLWSYSSWLYNYLCNQCISPLMFLVHISIRAMCTTLCDIVCQWLAKIQFVIQSGFHDWFVTLNLRISVVCFVYQCLFIFLYIIVLSLLSPFTASDFHLGIFKLFMHHMNSA